MMYSNSAISAMFRRFLPLLAVAALTTASRAQTDTAALEAALKGKQMWLRSYSADHVAQYEWSDDAILTKPVSLHALSAFMTRSVQLKKDKLIFEGDRSVMIRDAKKNNVMIDGKAPMTLEVVLHGADPRTVIPKIQSLIFFPDVRSAVIERPEWLGDLLPFDTPGVKHPERPTRIFENSKWAIAPPTAKIIPPQPVSIFEPGTTDAARQARVNGAVWLVLSVSETGQVGDVWLAAQPLGYGLYEEAAKAVRKYVFRPEQCDGRPVGTVLQTEVIFR